MKTRLFSGILLSALSFSSLGQSVFYPENGDYRYSFADVTAALKFSHGAYLTLNPKLALNGASYKLVAKRNDFQARDYFKYDWFKLQDIFSFNPESFTRSFKRSTFNDAKRAQFATFELNGKKWFHHKTVLSMREWGGLTHPPLKSIQGPLEKFDQSFAKIDYKRITSPYFAPDFQKEVDKASRSELSFGNIVKPLPDHYSYLAKIELISKAKQSIMMSSLVFVCDESGKQIVNLLIAKHRQGVDVKIMTDGMISRLMKHRECPKLMREAGIEVIETKDFFAYDGKAIYHTKTLIADFQEAVAGGQNVLNADNLSRGTDFSNRDVDLYVKGPMVTDIAKQFVQNWEYQRDFMTEGNTPPAGISSLEHYRKLVSQKLSQEKKAGVRGQEKYAAILGSTKNRMQGVCRFIKQAPYDDGHTITKAYLKFLDKVSHHLVITDPMKSDTYTGKDRKGVILIEKMDKFDMFNLLHEKVQKLAREGKKIDYLTTSADMAGNENVAMMNRDIREKLEAGDEWGADWSLIKLYATNKVYRKSHYENLIRDWMPFPNVHVWNHISFMHSKIFYFDRVLASVGSLNFQHNATDHAYESTSVCLDEGLNRELDLILVQDMANSMPLVFSKINLDD